MSSSKIDRSRTIIVDSIHRDIHLSPREVAIIDTASFQRLRQLKQLAMAHMVYPNATHTRFAHSIGTLGIMNRILQVATAEFGELSDDEKENLRLSALLHDVGHYPYSHLMEKLDRIQLTEKWVKGDTVQAAKAGYPNHEELGAVIVTTQRDLIDAIGGSDRAEEIARLFTGQKARGAKFSKLLHSSLDLDRLDYLLRDSHSTGVPYGDIDINYLLNALKVSPTGNVGFMEKALPAVEHLLLARFFMHRVIYYHKTTYGFEEACRQLLRRLREREDTRYGIPGSAKQVREYVENPKKLTSFTDALVDQAIQQSVNDENTVVSALARCIARRTPPKLLKEVCTLADPHTDEHYHRGQLFVGHCRSRLPELAHEFGIPLGQFLFCELPDLAVGQAPQRYTVAQFSEMKKEQIQDKIYEEEERDIRVFIGDDAEPKSLTQIDYSIVPKYAQYVLKVFRLYVIYEEPDREAVTSGLRKRIEHWDKP